MESRKKLMHVCLKVDKKVRVLMSDMHKFKRNNANLCTLYARNERKGETNYEEEP